MHRRRFIIGSAGTAALLAHPGLAAFAQSGGGVLIPSDRCHPTLRVSQGPYLLPDSPERSDIREDRPGVPLRLDLSIRNLYSCAPIPGAVVDIWHSDAGGLYSGVANEQFDFATLAPHGDPIDMRGRPTFLRGHQRADAQGRVAFTTIYPGWYMTRLTHVHIRAMVPGQQWTTLDTQLFFPPEIERAIFATGPYRARGANPFGLDRDRELRGNAAALAALTVPLEQTGDGYRGAATIAISA